VDVSEFVDLSLLADFDNPGPGEFGAPAIPFK